MKVLIIQPWISYRGAESVSLEEARGLKALGHEAWIACLYLDSQRLKNKDLRLNFILPPKIIARFCQRSNLFLFIFGFFILQAMIIIKGRRFDIYNAHNFPAVWVSVLAALIYRKPVYWTVHNFPQHGFTNKLVSKYWEKFTYDIDQKLVGKLNGIICVSEKVSKQVRNIYGLHSSVVYPPVDANYFQNGDSTKLQAGLQKKSWPIVLIPARLHEHKNPLFVLEVIKEFKAMGGKAVFVFAGEGELLTELKLYSKLNNLVGDTVFLGFISKEVLRNYYKAASLIFLPGYYGEGFNIVALEALCVEVPSLVLKNSGIDYWITKNKIGFVSHGSPREVAWDIKKLLLHKNQLAEAGSKGKKMVYTYHSPEAYATKMLAEFGQKVAL